LHANFFKRSFCRFNFTFVARNIRPIFLNTRGVDANDFSSARIRSFGGCLLGSDRLKRILKSVNFGMKALSFVLGGARSGKSSHAETLVTAHPAPWTYIATAQAYDDEMRERIAGESYLNFTRSIKYMMHMCFSIMFIQWCRKKIDLHGGDGK
jgi:hypothetical protein